MRQQTEKKPCRTWFRIRTIYDLDAMRLATKSVITVDAREHADLAFRTLADKKIKKAPVVQDGKLVGTLSRRNIMKALNIMEQSFLKCLYKKASSLHEGKF